MTSTASPFYQSIRESFLASPKSNSVSLNPPNLVSPKKKKKSGSRDRSNVEDTSAKVTELNNRLANIILSNRPSSHTTPKNTPADQFNTSNVRMDWQRCKQTSPTHVSYSHVSGADSMKSPSVLVREDSVKAEYDDEDILLPAEMDALRVVEIRDHVKVFVELPSVDKVTGQPIIVMSQICEDAKVKIFPNHVVISNAVTGDPIVEFVIIELVDANEDPGTESVTFIMEKKDGSKTSIQLVCHSNPARTAIYKIVCQKRSQTENLSMKY